QDGNRPKAINLRTNLKTSHDVSLLTEGLQPALAAERTDRLQRQNQGAPFCTRSLTPSANSTGLTRAILTARHGGLGGFFAFSARYLKAFLFRSLSTSVKALRRPSVPYFLAPYPPQRSLLHCRNTGRKPRR